MDSFKKYYERLEILKVKENQVRSSDIISEDFIASNRICVDLSNNGVTREYFEKIDNATTQLLEFYHDNIERSSTHALLYSYIPQKYKRRDYGDLKLCFLIDIIRCYEGLNHPTNLSTPEGVALLLLLTKAYYPSFFFNFESLSEIPEAVINLDAIIPYIGACSDEVGYAEDVIFVSKLLHEINPKADILYRQLIYRFCEAVSEVDSVISINEKEWLMGVLRLDDDDTSNDIVIDSIFTRN